MAKDKCPECPKCLPGWLVQFGDLMSLLLCFFILLLSMATMDKKKVEEYFEIMRRSMGFLEGAEDTAAAERMSQAAAQVGMSGDGSTEDDGSGSDAQESMQDIEEIAQEFNEGYEAEYKEVIISKKGNNEFSLDIPSSLMFDEGEYQINNPKAKKFIAKLSRIIRTMPEELDIEVMGYAGSNINNDDIPRDSWDISALRAIAVVKELIRNRIEPATLKVSAFGSYRPKSDAQSDNRRVELRFIAAENKSKDIQEANFFDRIKE
ncbi:MAG: OmpA family protein [Arcobacteraceae bacterium]|nr:OmpA family protein [Arcobacteraceae bacterium]